MHFFPLSFVNCAILHPLFLFEWFCTPSFYPLFDFAPHFCVQLHFCPYLFANCAILHPLFLLFWAILHSIFCPFSPLLMMILNKTQLTKDGVQNCSKKRGGAKTPQLANNRGKWYLYNHFYTTFVQLSISYSHYLLTLSLSFSLSIVFDQWEERTTRLSQKLYQNGCSNIITLFLFLSLVHVWVFSRL